ncbi:DUF6305 family protein [Metallumcola ferriviriculae]|uniref:DUF6305 family protein n=1 Tax=Metallumcola ferriviriculae TaxID=3039180 RepID=A0AAU0USV8_9FIRM|nr:DUF6305 family protein [Desulfitibacteraceae bacterium MK1]
MRKTTFMILLIMALLISGCGKSVEKPFLMPHLPQPIAHERAIITPAGQGSEGLIISELASKLYISNRFWRKVRGQDLSDRYDCIIISLGMSHRGMDRLGVTLPEEKERLVSLAADAQKRGMAVVVVSMSRQRRYQGTDEIAKAIAPFIDYYLIIGDANHDNFFSRLAAAGGVPITVVKDFDRAKTPINSIFR